ncbi:MAG TPA: hypothetical protein VL069_16240, partial [Opitutus sp.]|nr:hypothetical protein [Opitutus sp.]
PGDLLQQHAAQVRALAAERGVGLVDSLAAFERFVAEGGQITAVMAQRNHPNASGHAFVAHEIARWFP